MIYPYSTQIIMFKYLFVPIFFLAASLASYGQANMKRQIGDTLSAIANRHVRVERVTVRSIRINTKSKTVTVTATNNLSYLPFRKETVDEIHAAIRSLLPSHAKSYRIVCKTGQHTIEQLVPNYFRTEDTDKSRLFTYKETSPPLVTNLSSPNKPEQGLRGKHIALWPGHGWHYEQKQATWKWQRARLMQTVEDLYTFSFVMPFLTPMLENAGANVLLPRERDTQRNEVIVDNDKRLTGGTYGESPLDEYEWSDGENAGFAHTKHCYLHGENPFSMGTYRQCFTTTNDKKQSRAFWVPHFPETGKYAVYVSYHTLPNSTDDARYSVYHKGGVTHFTVNQQMGGGTWIYLGHFDFDAGEHPEKSRVELTNYSSEEKRVVTADAVKFGGGMGNVARSPLATDTLALWRDTSFFRIDPQHEAFATPHHAPSSSPDSLLLLRINENSAAILHNLSCDTMQSEHSIAGEEGIQIRMPEVSGYPRYAEGARYWLQWAGVPDSVYSRTNRRDDYSDDFQSRGFWVNYLCGGSEAMPEDDGLRIPLDLAMGFHSDAGITPNDSVIGTLVICSTFNTDRKHVYKNGVSRMASRDLADLVQTQIVHDLRLTHAPEWMRRGTWDKSYSESRVPEVPSMLLELLSHQNFADMRYGLDPRFRFTVCRAIYKGLLKYFESTDGIKRVVQPLPVKNFHLFFTGKKEIELHWQPTSDPLEPSAHPDGYIVYTQMDNTGFDNGYRVNDNRCRFILEPGHIYNFKVTAVNEGGESFPSETLSACRSLQDRGEVLIINAFDRVAAPGSFEADSTRAGFVYADDAGVPYLADMSFVGEQYEFCRNAPWVDNDAPGFGASHGTNEATLVAGNTFDYPVIHGRAIREAGYSYVSAGKGAVLEGNVSLSSYPVVDLIIGKQRETYMGNRHDAPEYETFSVALQKEITDYCLGGGNLLVSGAYIASDLYQKNDTTGENVRFVNEVLRCRFGNAQGTPDGVVQVMPSSVAGFRANRFHLYTEPNAHSYHVECPDAIEPIDQRGRTICCYDDTNLSAGVADDTGTYKVCALGFPFEAIKEESGRNQLMEDILRFFEKPASVHSRPPGRKNKANKRDFDTQHQ